MNENEYPSINAAGNRIAFVSRANLTGQNGDANREVFLYDTATGLVQVTNSSGGIGSFEPSINAAGNRIAFSSDRNLTGLNGDGNGEIFLARVPLPARDLTGQVRIRRMAWQQVGPRRYRITLFVKARRQKAVFTGPLALIVNGLPEGTQLIKAAGVTDDYEPLGRPYRLLPLKRNRLTGKREVRLTLTFVTVKPKRPRCSFRIMEAANPI